MSIVFLNTSLKSKNENHTFKGKAINKKNTFTYNDDVTITKVTLDDVIVVERKNIKLFFKEGKKIEGIYNTPFGHIKLETYTKEIKKEKNKIIIKYNLLLDNQHIDTFTYIFEYSIDS